MCIWQNTLDTYTVARMKYVKPGDQVPVRSVYADLVSSTVQDASRIYLQIPILNAVPLSGSGPGFHSFS